MKALALHIILALSVSWILGEDENLIVLKSDPNKMERFCGYQIGNIIKAVCNGTYANGGRYVNGRTIRSVENMPSLEALFKDNEDINDEDRAVHRFINRVAARRIIFKTHRRRRGVVNECCVKSCSYNELLMYCGDKTDTR